VENTAATAPKSLRKRCLYDVAQLVTDAEKENAVCSERLYCFSGCGSRFLSRPKCISSKNLPTVACCHPPDCCHRLLDWTYHAHRFIFTSLFFYSVFCLVPCGRLSWLFVCFQAHIKCFIIVSCHVVWAGFGVTALGQPASLMTAAAAATPRANHDGGYVTFLVSVQSER